MHGYRTWRRHDSPRKSPPAGSWWSPRVLMKDTPKSRRTRARILAAATRLFAEIGYHAAANALIAEAAGVTRGAMLYHFPRREGPLEAVGVPPGARSPPPPGAGGPCGRRWWSTGGPSGWPSSTPPPPPRRPASTPP